MPIFDIVGFLPPLCLVFLDLEYLVNPSVSCFGIDPASDVEPHVRHHLRPLIRARTRKQKGETCEQIPGYVRHKLAFH